MTYNKKCKLCDKPLPEWWEDVFYWKKNSHRWQCYYCGRCLPHYFIGRKCDECKARAREEKKRIKEEMNIIREKRERFACEQILKEQEARELEIERLKKVEINQYRQLRKEIEAMPQYQQWRQAVFEKFGKKCIVCGFIKNIEVDHRYESFYAIVRKYKITNVMQAYECFALWDVNNGAPLCKLHHDQTRSSIYHRQNNS